MISNSPNSTANTEATEHIDKNISKILQLITYNISDPKPNTFNSSIYNNVVIIEKAKTNGSLYNLFTSDWFTIDNIFYYLNKQNEKGIIDWLINQMSSKFINNSLFYWPQIISLLSYKPYIQSIVTYLLDRCINQVKFSIIINWLVWSNDNIQNGFIAQRFEKFNNRIEMTWVNGRRVTMSQYTIYKTKRSNSQYEVLKHSINKGYRWQYFHAVWAFYSKWKLLCEDLKNYPKEEEIPEKTRDFKMRSKLQEVNSYISSIYNKSNDVKSELSIWFRGILLPFDDCEFVDDEYNNIIVRTIPKYSMCFSTKARVPVKIVCECIRAYECTKWDELYIKEDGNDNTNEVNQKTVEYSSIDDFFNKMTIQDRQFQLKQQEEFNRREINKILEDVKYSNEHPDFEGKKQRLSWASNNDKKQEEFWCIEYIDQNKENPFGEKWTDITGTIMKQSPYRNFETYSIKTFIAKADDDWRQEVMTMQLIKQFDIIFKKEGIPLHVFPYEILITSSSSGWIEFVPNTTSIDCWKKKIYYTKHNTLSSFFKYFFKDNFEEAQRNFAESLAAYSWITYWINIKDRHNGNILIDMNGNIVHIDFGFILGISPGNMNFETAPFKFTNDYLEILMDGGDSFMYDYYVSLIVRGWIAARKNYQIFESIILIMQRGSFSNMPCFTHRAIEDIMREFKSRFFFDKTEYELVGVVDDLVKTAKGNWRTGQYDYFQKLTNGIMP